MVASRITNPINRLNTAQALVAAGADLSLANGQGVLAFQMLDGEDAFPELRALLTPTVFNP